MFPILVKMIKKSLCFSCQHKENPEKYYYDEVEKLRLMKSA